MASQLDQSADIRRHLRAWLADHPARTIAAFASLPGEPMLLPLLEDLCERRWALPRIDGETMRFHLTTAAELVPGAFGILEPPADSPVCALGDIDLFLCPGMAFTATGSRLGRGKGYYDRCLAAAPAALRAGVCFREQVVPSLPVEPRDQPMQFLATPDAVRDCR